MDVTSQPPVTDQPARPVREPRVWILRAGGIKIQADDGTVASVRLLPREMRRLANLLQYHATEIDREQPSRIFGKAIVD